MNKYSHLKTKIGKEFISVKRFFDREDLVKAATSVYRKQQKVKLDLLEVLLKEIDSIEDGSNGK